MKKNKALKFIAIFFIILFASTGCVEKKCFENSDCSSGKICNSIGECAYECETSGECGANFTCLNNHCMPQTKETLSCPSDMVLISNSFCIDKYEASRPDATDTNIGSDESKAVSKASVLPWQVESNATAEKACNAVGKRLCTSNEWIFACKGPNKTEYAYGNTYEPKTCNGIDTFGREDFHLMPTGSFPDCTNDWGVFDLNGNLWEHIAGGNDMTVRGGAYNCSDSATFHRCDYVPGNWTPVARGFRCCYSGASSETQEEPTDSGATDAIEAGCVDGGEDATVDSEIEDAADVEIGDDTGDTDDIDDAGDDVGQTDTGLIDGCPADMVPVGNYCFDRYEASHSDATDASQGSSETASTRADVLPWFPVTLEVARAGCVSMGKRLCTADEWFNTCTGTAKSTYSYGNEYSPLTCNGIDTYCDCSLPACAGLNSCPYPHCNAQASSGGGGPCPASFHVMPTGSFADCTNNYGAYDINGNVWEIVESNDGLEHFRGGAFNCSDSETFHRCDYDATWGPSAKGFRCCLDRVEK